MRPPAPPITMTLDNTMRRYDMIYLGVLGSGTCCNLQHLDYHLNPRASIPVAVRQCAPGLPVGDPTSARAWISICTWENCREGPGPIRTRRHAKINFVRGSVRDWAWASSRRPRTPGEAITSKGDTPGQTHPDIVAHESWQLCSLLMLI